MSAPPELFGPFGVLVLMVSIGIAVAHGTLRLGREVDGCQAQLASMRDERDEWKGRCFAALEAAEKGTDLAAAALARGTA